MTQLNAGGSGLRWSTFLGGTWYGFSQFPVGTNTINAVGQDAAGNVAVAGRADADDFPTTPGILQPKIAGPATQGPRSTDGFLSKLNPTGTALLFSTYLGGSVEDRVNDLQMDAQGNIWVTGATASTDFPGNPASFKDHSSPECRATVPACWLAADPRGRDRPGDSHRRGCHGAGRLRLRVRCCRFPEARWRGWRSSASPVRPAAV